MLHNCLKYRLWFPISSDVSLPTSEYLFSQQLQLLNICFRNNFVVDGLFICPIAFWRVNAPLFLRSLSFLHCNHTHFLEFQDEISC